MRQHPKFTEFSHMRDIFTEFTAHSQGHRLVQHCAGHWLLHKKGLIGASGTGRELEDRLSPGRPLSYQDRIGHS